VGAENANHLDAEKLEAKKARKAEYSRKYRESNREKIREHGSPTASENLS
jgi:hypothetical protein